MIPTIDAFRCNGCGVCVRRCPPKIMGMVKEIAVLVSDLCEECGICNDVCPVDAVRFSLPERSFRSGHDGYHPIPR